VIDTHAHLDACDDPPERLVERAHAAGVERILTVGTTVEGSRGAVALAERHLGVFAIVGIHPHEAGDADGVGELRDLLGHERAVAVGETGLDFYRDWAPRDRQHTLFERHLELAAELGKPVVVHTRAADRETLDTLAGFQGDVVLHCFSSPPMLRDALERGYYISFAGNVTYKNASELRVAASQVPVDRLLTETDSPYLAPQPLRGRPNEPANVAHVLDALAATRHVEPEELAAQIDANAQRVFGLP
jgi:TatD DNase family protein